jgi:uncharacterized protein (DUF2225 family)/uncharacterized membrane protein YebE (DUF533 family)
MSVPVQNLTNDQKVWYAQLVVAAILADNEIDMSEMEFLKQVLTIVNDPQEKKNLMTFIGHKKAPPLSEPSEIKKETLAAIFIELVLIMISDLDFDDKEKAFLKKVAKVFNLADRYFLAVMRWGVEGLEWKGSQEELFPSLPKNFQVPLDQLNSAQKLWYAQALISSIMCDGVIDKEEVSFIKMASSFIDDPKEKQKLMAFVKNKMVPPMKAPPNIPPGILGQIYIDVMMTISADENISYKEQAFLKQLADFCDFSKGKYDEILGWSNKGITWKQDKNNLIAKIEFAKKVDKVDKPVESSKNNSILERNVQCFVCKSEKTFKVFQLKSKTQKSDRNIFGIITYSESNEGYDMIDYNLVKIIVCPTCYFASAQKEMFKRSEKNKTPEVLSDKFRKSWKESIERRKKSVKGIEPELETLDRSLTTVFKTYQLAIATASSLADATNDPVQKWMVVSLMLNLAEILSDNGEPDKADQYLKQTAKKAEDVFKEAQNDTVSFKSARILLLIALYFSDIRTAGTYIDFIIDMVNRKMDTLDAADAILLKKIHGETKKAVEDRDNFKKENLSGFHMEI